MKIIRFKDSYFIINSLVNYYGYGTFLKGFGQHSSGIGEIWEFYSDEGDRYYTIETDQNDFRLIPVKDYFKNEVEL